MGTSSVEWTELTLARKEFKELYAHCGPNVFKSHLAELYGIELKYVDHVTSYCIIDEKKYLLFLLKWG